jgi:phenylacetate-CoA ligase
MDERVSPSEAGALSEGALTEGALTEAQRFPLLTAEGRRLLHWLHESPFAPRYTNRCGSRLSAEGLRRVQAFEAELRQTIPGWRPGELPGWLPDFVTFCYREVPFYRRNGVPPGNFASIPTFSRAQLRAPWEFVPDDQPLDDLIVYATSGTTGHPIDILSHPETASKYLPLLCAALATRGVRLTAGAGKVACLLVCFQKSTFTYASVSPWLGDAGFAKINLNPADWRDPDDRVKFLDACNPEIYTGDPLSFAALARLPLASRPKALVSTAMALGPAQQAALEAHFGCPVLDTYSLNEAGLVAVGGATGGHALLQPRLYVEILDPAGQPCAPGVRGEVVLTGGYNPFLPLLRYRTGDFADLAFRGNQPVLVGLEGRPPTTFRTAAGDWLNNVDVSIALRRFALPCYTLHQAADGVLTLRLLGASVYRDSVRAALLNLFGADQRLLIEDLPSSPPEGKLIQYVSAFTD